MSTEILLASEAEVLAQSALVAAGASAEAAAAAARALVLADCDGIASHGLARVPSYAAQLRSGKIDGAAKPAVIRTSAATAAVDAKCGLAYPALVAAVAEGLSMLGQVGIAAVGVHNSHHAGALGLVVEDMVRACGAFALAVVNTPAAIAPAGSARPLLGTNPIAFACPLQGEDDPLVVDLSLSVVARGRIMLAAQRGEPIPDGWAVDAAGRPTCDPRAALEGAMLAIGGAKGAALALMVELLAAALTGAHAAFEATSLFDASGEPPCLGHLLVAFRPGAFGADAATVARRVAVVADRLRAEPGVRLPGERRFALRRRSLSEGIAYPADLVAELRALAASARRSLSAHEVGHTTWQGGENA